MTDKTTTPPISKILLQLIAGVGQAGVDFYTMLYDLKYHRGDYLRGGHAYVKEMKRLREKYYARQALRQLKLSHYIKSKKIGDKLMITLTEKGRQKTLADQLKKCPISKHGYLVVIFDIPENQKLVRRQWRQLLKQGGFTKLQQSVWVSQSDNYPTLKNFINETNLTPWVNIFYGTNFLTPPK